MLAPLRSGCWTDFNVQCLRVSAPVVVNNTYTFTLSSSCASPLIPECTQNLHKVEFNSCKWRTHAAARPRPS